MEKYTYSPSDTQQLIDTVCKKGKVGKLPKGVQEALLNQYEGYKRDALRLGFNRFDAERGFGAIIGQSCEKKLAGFIPFANSQHSIKKMLEIENASGRRNSFPTKTNTDNTEAFKKLTYGDVVKASKAACAINNPSPNVIKYAKNVIAKYADTEFLKIEGAVASKIEKKRDKITILTEKHKINIAKEKEAIDKIKQAGIEKRTNLKEKLIQAFTTLCNKGNNSQETYKNAPF
jgi:hypothetical protein